MSFVLIDTSCWVESFRASGKEEIRAQIYDLIASEKAAWCGMIQIELWKGARGLKEIQFLQELEDLDSGIKLLTISPSIWQKANILAHQARKAGLTVPAADILIVACALSYKVELLHQDKHIKSLLELS